MSDATKPIQVFGEYDERTWQQMLTCMEFADYGVLSADNHLGYNHPVGGGTASADYISVSGVGWDIGCGNKAVQTNVLYAEIRDELPAIMDEIVRVVSFGVGRKATVPADHEVLDKITNADVHAQRQWSQLAAQQLGTVGAGNHYVDLFRDEAGFVWIGVHFGSRGFGHKTAGLFFRETDMMGPPTVLPVESGEGQMYIVAMQLAGEYARAGRDVVVNQVLRILQTPATAEVHNHHNFAWHEEHFGRKLWVVRKGCTPAFPGQEGFVGGSMGDISVILEGQDTDANRDGLYSTVHGAGRQMSRTAAGGKQRKRWTCNNRDCDWFQGPGEHKPEACPKCDNTRLSKQWQTLSPGVIDWEATLADLEAKGIELRGGAADEAPGAYKRIEEVLAAHGDTIRIRHVLTPVGVAMAPSEMFDPYKD